MNTKSYKVILAVLSAFIFTSAPKAYASYGAEPLKLNDLCQTSQLSSFTIQVSNPIFEGKDFCYIDSVLLPVQVSQTITQIGILHKRAADLFNLLPGQLIAQPLKIILRSVSKGYLSSRASGSAILMGVFSDWNGEPINEGVYLHELGHTIAYTPNLFLPSALAEISTSVFIAEAIADLIAILISGSLEGKDGTLPSCLQGIRVITRAQSYSAAAGYFRSDFTARRLDMCCTYLDRIHGQTPHSAALCSNLSVVNKVTPFDRTKFTPDLFQKHPNDFDQHQLGIPLNSFFVDLKNTTGINPFRLVMTALERMNLSKTNTFVCTIPNLSEVVGVLTFKSLTFAKVLSELIALIPAEHVGAFKKLWKKHRMDILFNLSKYDPGLPINRTATAALYTPFDNGSNDAKDYKHEIVTSACWETHPQDPKIGRINKYVPGCSASCVQQETDTFEFLH